MPNHYDFAVFIGRFQPFHLGHLHVFKKALQQAKKLIVLVGSSDGARTLRNPFRFDERLEMIQAALPDDIAQRIIFKPLPDFTYDDAAWVEAVSKRVANCLSYSAQSVALIGHSKDETTYYLKLFPDWNYIEVDNLAGINATAVRARYFSSESPADFNSQILPEGTLIWLKAFSQTSGFNALKQEYHSVLRFKSAWSDSPYPVIFTTTDALIRWRDELLIIQRKNYPGKGLWALPGGFLNPDETLLAGCLRELVEETQITVDTETLKRHLVKHRVFDSPKRSSRGRVITYCYYFDLSSLPQKPLAEAADDAQQLFWVEIAKLQQQQFFEDHFFIIHSLLKSTS